jgi:hypothetical protein
MKSEITLVIVLFVLAGCTGPVGTLGSDQTDTSVRSDVVSPTVGGTTKTAEPTSNSAVVEQSEKRTDGIEAQDARRILLSLSELPPKYSFEGEVDKHLNEGTEDERSALKREGLIAKYKRLFRSAASPSTDPHPRLVLSAVVVYQNKSTAKRVFTQTKTSLSDDGANVTSQTLGGVSVTNVQFENDRGSYNTIHYYRDSNVLLYAITTGDSQYFDQTGEKYLLKMLGELESTE